VIIHALTLAITVLLTDIAVSLNRICAKRGEHDGYDFNTFIYDKFHVYMLDCSRNTLRDALRASFNGVLQRVRRARRDLHRVNTNNAIAGTHIFPGPLLNVGNLRVV
jgi:hypothetical protein